MSYKVKVPPVDTLSPPKGTITKTNLLQKGQFASLEIFSMTFPMVSFIVIVVSGFEWVYLSLIQSKVEGSPFA